MYSMGDQEKNQLLEALMHIAPGYGVGENESRNERLFFKNFLPLKEYKKLFEPDLFLITGGRGAGKTELFRLFSYSKGRHQLYISTKSRVFDDFSQTDWFVACGHDPLHSKKFPVSDVVERALKNSDETLWNCYWSGMLLGVILQEGNIQEPIYVLDDILVNSLKNQLRNPSEWLPLVETHYEEISNYLDALDEYLDSQDQWFFFLYDELDKIVMNYKQLAIAIRVLLSFWLERSRRWRKIRPKIFLRTDLFRDEFLGFADASKLSPNQISLQWSTLQLYQLVAKRLVNQDMVWKKYLQEYADFSFIEDADFGLMPSSDAERYYEQMMEVIVGKFMGANPRKGRTYNWIPNHLQDSDGRIAPRSFLRLFVIAAEIRKNKGDYPVDTRLLQPQDLQAALQQTSQDRIGELTQEEYPWINDIQVNLKGLEAPIPKEIFLEAIQNTKWREEYRPPHSEAEDILYYLKKLGVVEIRLTDERINIPEIYLYGFEMKRRGGVKRPK